MKKVLQKCLKGICFLGIFCLLFLGFQELLRAKWVIGGREHAAGTSTFREYRSLEDDTVDALFIGTSHIYYAIDSMNIYEQTGMSCFAIGGPGLRMDLTYLALKEALRTQSPKVVLLDMSAVHYTKPQTEARTHMFADEITLDAEKIEFAYRNKSEELDPLGVMFPLIRYHSRWSDLNKTDVQYVTGTLEDTTLRGHYVSYRQVPTKLKFKKKKKNFALTQTHIEYFARIAELCKEEQIELVLFKIPTPEWSVTESEAVAALAKEHGVPFLELYYEMENIGLDPATDFHDETDHINQYGAEKLAGFFAKYLKENYNLPDHRGEYTRWDEDIEKYHAFLEEEKKKQEEKLKKQEEKLKKQMEKEKKEE